jgi:hypothetical protein
MSRVDDIAVALRLAGYQWWYGYFFSLGPASGITTVGYVFRGDGDRCRRGYWGAALPRPRNADWTSADVECGGFPSKAEAMEAVERAFAECAGLI